MGTFLLMVSWDIQQALFGWLFTEVLDIPEKRKFMLWYVLPYSVISAVRAVYNDVELLYLFNSLFILFWMVVCIRKFSRDSMKKGILAILEVFMLAFLAEGSAMSVFGLLFPDRAKDMMNQGNIAAVGFFISVEIVLIGKPLYIWLFKKLYTELRERRQSFVMKVLIFLLFVNMLLNIYQFVAVLRETGRISMELNVRLMICSVLPICMAFYIWYLQSRKEKLEKERHRMELEKLQFAEQEKRREAFSKIRHDYNAQMTAALGLLEQGETESAKRLLLQNQEKLLKEGSQ